METEIMTAEAVLCKRCLSSRIIKSGMLQGSQRYQCKDCGCVFINNAAPLHGRLPVSLLAEVMESFFTGLPLDSIRSAVLENQGIPVTITGLEKIIYRLARKAVRLIGDTLPELHPLWVIEGSLIPGDKPLCLLDVLDSDTGFIIASDVIPDFAEKSSVSVVKNALHISSVTPDKIVIGPFLLELCLNSLDFVGLTEVPFTPQQELSIVKYQAASLIRLQIVARRLNFDSLSNIRLINAAWRVHYSFLTGAKPAGLSACNSWLDVIKAAEIPGSN
jgi:hypothetical protein